MQLGFIGLGKMGSRMAEKLLREGHEVVVWNRSEEPVKNLELRIKNYELSVELSLTKTIEELMNALEKPRIVWSMLPAGEPTESMLEKLGNLADVDAGDILIDGGNSYYKDTQRRYEEFQKRGIRFLGIGVSGGILAFENGYPLMVGGDALACEEMTPILDSLSKPNGGHEYFGTGGAGHFVKMVHNGIEYGVMQAIGEGFGILERSSYDLDLVKVASLWQKNTIVSSFLIDRAKDALEKDPGLKNIIGEIDATGEAEWTVDQAKEENVPIENIRQALEFRKRSKTDKSISDSFAARLVAALRAEFGGHAVKKK